jgi:hypothetical protein
MLIFLDLGSHAECFMQGVELGNIAKSTQLAGNRSPWFPLGQMVLSNHN